MWDRILRGGLAFLRRVCRLCWLGAEDSLICGFDGKKGCRLAGSGSIKWACSAGLRSPFLTGNVRLGCYLAVAAWDRMRLGGKGEYRTGFQLQGILRTYG